MLRRNHWKHIYCCVEITGNPAVSVCSYMAFGDDTAGYVFDNLPSGLFVTLVKLALSLELICT